MSTTGASDLLLAPDVTFDVDRFDWAGDDRLELVGRWSGVRGLRFVRPVLTVPVAGRRRRLVALLEHKPWVASDGDEWVAAFSWEGHREAVGPAQLAVGPSLVVDLPAPGPRRGPPHGEPSLAERALRRAERAEARAARETEAAQALLRREREAHELRRAELEADVEGLQEDVAATRAIADELRMEMASARARLGDALAETDRLREAHDRRESELEAAAADRVAAERERAELLERRVAELSAQAAASAAKAAAAEAAASAAAQAKGEAAASAAEQAERESPPDQAEEAAPGAAEPAHAEAAARAAESPEAAPAPAPGQGASDGRRTVRILDGPQRVPEVKPLLIQAAPLRRTAGAVWARRVGAIVVLLAALVALVLILHGSL
jgi:hypothetical protein